MKYENASDEPLGVIEINECGAPDSLTTRRFRRLFNELSKLNTELERALRAGDTYGLAAGLTRDVLGGGKHG